MPRPLIVVLLPSVHERVRIQAPPSPVSISPVASSITNDCGSVSQAFARKGNNVRAPQRACPRSVEKQPHRTFDPVNKRIRVYECPPRLTSSARAMPRCPVRYCPLNPCKKTLSHLTDRRRQRPILVNSP